MCYFWLMIHSKNYSNRPRKKYIFRRRTRSCEERTFLLKSSVLIIKSLFNNWRLPRENVYTALGNLWTEAFALCNQGRIISWAPPLVSPPGLPSSSPQLSPAAHLEAGGGAVSTLRTCPQRAGNLSFASSLSSTFWKRWKKNFLW